MVTKVDLLVIGGGMAGAMAAISAAEEGRHVMVVRRGLGATALSSGAIDLRGALAWLEQTLGTREGAAQALDRAVNTFRALAASAGYAHCGGAAQKMDLVNPLGTTKRTELAPGTMASGDLGKLAGARVLFVGVRGHSDFDAPHIARSLKSLTQHKHRSPAEIGSAEIEFPGIRQAGNISSFDLAQLMDDETIAAECGRRIAALVRSNHYSHVALPPVVGRYDPEQAASTIQEVLGLPCFETLGLPPSVPGYRLQQVLDHALAQSHVRIAHAIADGFDARQGRVVRVRATQKKATYEFVPAAIVLASGKFIAGGLRRNGRLREAVFDLPVFVDGRFEPGTAMEHLVTNRFTARQPIFGAGIRVNGRLQPVTADGQVVFQNLFAAGSIVTGYDYSRGDGGLGICLANGYLCGKNAVSYAGAFP